MNLIQARIPESLQKGDSNTAFSGSDSGMNAEYQRLEAESSKVQKQIDELVKTCEQMAATDFQKFEAKIAELHQRLAGLRQAMGLLTLAGSSKMQAQEAKMAKSQPKTFHSQGTRPKTVQLTGGVKVTLHITCYHRFLNPEKAKNKKTNRGMYRLLILPGIASGLRMVLPFLAMKLIAGQTLANEMKSDDRPRLLQVFNQVCQAVGVAHSRGVIHRDLKCPTS